MLVNFLNVHCPHLQSRFKIIERLVTANKRPSSIHTSCIITGSGGTSSRRTSTMGSTSKTPLKQMGAKAVYPNPDPIYVPFASRRSVVHSTGGMVACTQVLASEAGQRILKMGGNAADAAVAVAAALNVTEPTSTGIGGDMFCLYFDAKTKKIHALNGSGRSPKNSSLEQIRKDLDLKPGQPGKIPMLSALSVTVPGAAAGWVDTVEKFGSGKLSMEQILMPAIELCENGFPVGEHSAHFWKYYEQSLRDASPYFREMLKRDKNAEQFVRAPRAGEIMRNPTLGKTFRTLAAEGKKGFYSGRIAKAIVDGIKMLDGHMELSDLTDHLELGTEETTPISFKFRGQNVSHPSHPASDNAPSRHVELWEHPPNGQGIVALMALGIFENLEKNKEILPFRSEDHNTVDYLHALIESLRIAFADANWWVTDPHPDHSPVPPADLISRPYLAERAKLFSREQAGNHEVGKPGPSPAQNHSDTVYFAVTDKEGNGMSFINSNYAGFGSAILPEGCGFTLQNRGANFELGPADHPNIYKGGKRPYHTIIPGLVTHGSDDAEGERELHSVFGVMGGFMQPQGHMQVLLNMEVFGMNPQQALDAPRICIGAGMPDQGDGQTGGQTVYIEDGIADETVKGLQKLGHSVEVLAGWDRSMFGRGQVIRQHWDGEGEDKVRVWSGGSDLRGDGCAMPA